MAGPDEQKRILFIDDDEDLADALSIMLEAAGYEVLRASSGEEGLSLAARTRPDVILLDYMLPGKSGPAVCRELRRIDGLGDVPVIAMTAFGPEVNAVGGFGDQPAAGAVRDFLEKPVEPAVLLDRVAQAIAGHGGAAKGS